MLTKYELHNVLFIFAEGVKELFGDKLKGLILFGSYAREDFDEESDIDIMILVDIDKSELHKYRTLVSQIADRADWDYETLLSPMIKSFSEFEKYKESWPFYHTVNMEGVRLIA
jgi:predicted nucleotidyltransferase